MLQLGNWKGDAGSSSSKKGAKQKLEIVLPVPAGQEELAELLIKGNLSVHDCLIRCRSYSSKIAALQQAS
jgi:hypothetical protein